MKIFTIVIMIMLSASVTFAENTHDVRVKRVKSELQSGRGNIMKALENVDKRI